MPAHFHPEIAKLGAAHLVTPDLEKSLWFFHEVIGLEITARTETKVYLRAAMEREHHSLVLEAGDRARLDHVSWRVRRPEDLEGFHTLLTDNGNDVAVDPANSEDGYGESLRISSPAGHRFRLYYDVDKPGVAEADRSVLLNQRYRSWNHGIGVRRIDHVNLWTTHDPEVQHRWLSDNLGFRLREYIQTPAGRVGGWMSVTPLVHDIAVMQAGPQEASPARMHHLAFWLDNAADVLRAADIVVEAGLTPDQGPGKHGVSQAFFLYVRDPGSGHRVEIFSNGYLIFDPDWEPVEWGPEDIAMALTMWGPTDYVPHTDDNIMNTTTEA
ncbi:MULTISPECIES: VOC family protein [unclassified Brevibacterium]|uniref:VOC family protein n=1 Tax=unclassified Brevibacterium TaxID=2614124 RepID=UPI0010F92D52|nr:MULTISPECIES: VOC family protein [unclassified Brevibacterium]MCM1011726.1 VOC family protein [Brevibacterium sp. XM4083]